MITHRQRIQNAKQIQEQPDDSMMGFFYFMFAIPFICIAGIAAAIHYASKIDQIPNWLIISSICVILIIFGVWRVSKMVKK